MKSKVIRFLGLTLIAFIYLGVSAALTFYIKEKHNIFAMEFNLSFYLGFLGHSFYIYVTKKEEQTKHYKAKLS